MNGDSRARTAPVVAHVYIRTELDAYRIYSAMAVRSFIMLLSHTSTNRTRDWKPTWRPTPKLDGRKLQNYDKPIRLHLQKSATGRRLQILPLLGDVVGHFGRASYHTNQRQ